MLIVVNNQQANTYPYRRKLYTYGLRYSRYGRKWQINTPDKKLGKEITGFCRSHNLHYECIADNYVRSNTYRKEFLTSYGRIHGKFRCAYCGKKITEKEMTVDHIIPVHKVRHKGIVRSMMKWSGISNINDINNLAPACRRCNTRKGTKINAYYYARGMLGRTYTGAAAVHYALIVAVGAACLCASTLFLFGQYFFMR